MSTKSVDSNDKPKTKYKGNYDENQNLHGIGTYEWTCNEYAQNYSGRFHTNNLHGTGIYQYESEHTKLFYDGPFYLNKFEGYAQIFYENGSSFQGLFKENRRFGPGILTYENGCKDVGIWMDNYLVRLSSCVNPKLVPELATTSSGKMKLFQYKKLISLETKTEELISEKLNLISNNEVRNTNSLFFNKKMYDKEFYGDEDFVIDIIVTEEEFSTDDEEFVEDSTELQKDARYNLIKDQIKLLNDKIEEVKYLISHVKYQIKFCLSCCFASKEEDTEHEMKTRDIGITNMDDYLKELYKSTEFAESPIKETKNISDDCKCKKNKIGDVRELENLKLKLQKHQKYLKNIQKYLNYRLAKEYSPKTCALPTKKVKVTELLSHNNEPVYIDILKHCFLNRKTENNIDFDPTKILSGSIKKYRRGTYEKECLKFLRKCSEGTHYDLLELFQNCTINPDLCDSRGNTGVILAAVANNIECLRILANFGAKIDALNDEGLSALNICILKYISIKFGVKDWEKAFLPKLDINDDEKEEVTHWYPHESLQSLTKFASDDLKISKISIEVEQSYIFSTSFISKEQQGIGEECSEDNTLLKIFETILVLLQLKSNPNACEVPIPTLFLSIFSESADLVKYLLFSNANSNQTITNELLTPLHIIASLRPCPENLEMCKNLLRFCKSDLKTSDKHWQDRKAFLIGNDPLYANINDSGKNALHILCLRQDYHLDNCNFFENMTKSLIEEINLKDTYLGHNALSIATLTGNLIIIKTLFESQKISPYSILEHNMGNIMTLLLLKRYKDYQSFDKCKEILDVIVDLGGNPLHMIGDFENCIEFMEKEYEEDSTEKDKNKNKKSKSETKKNIKLSPQDLLKGYMYELCRKTILKYIQMELVFGLFNLAELDNLENDLLKYITQFLNPSFALGNLKILFNSKKIPVDRFDRNVCKKVLEFVEIYQRKEIKKKEKPTKKDKGKKIEIEISAELEPATLNFNELIDSTDFSPKDNIVFLNPGLDNEEKYKVCFNCLRRKNKELLPCPNCELVYYCSDECNKLGSKLDSFHNCKNIFYKTLKKEIEENEGFRDMPSSLSKIMYSAEKSCIDKLIERKKQEEMKKQQILQEKLAQDTYGLMSLKGKKLVSQTSNKYFMEKVLSSLSQKLLLEEKKSVTRQSIVEKKAKSETRLSRIDSENVSTINSVIPSGATLNIQSVHEIFPDSSRSKHDLIMDAVVFERESKVVKRKKCTTKTCKNLPCKKCPPSLKKEANLDMVDVAKADLFLRKLQKLPTKYQYFIEMLSKYFPDLDLSFLYVPYACYSGGQLYYKFLDGNYFSETYSAM